MRGVVLAVMAVWIVGGIVYTVFAWRQDRDRMAAMDEHGVMEILPSGEPESDGYRARHGAGMDAGTG